MHKTVVLSNHGLQSTLYHVYGILFVVIPYRLIERQHFSLRLPYIWSNCSYMYMYVSSDRPTLIYDDDVGSFHLIAFRR